MILSKARRLFSSQPFKMAARRSARLSASAAELVDAKVAVNGANGANGTATATVSKKRKVAEESQKDNDGFAVPATPKKKKSVADAPPSTPTPAGASIMAVAASNGDSTGRARPPRNRLANPHLTNAPLISPQTSRLVAREDVELASPSKLAALPDGTTTGDILDKALAHIIAIEPKLKPIVEKHKCRIFSPEGLAEEIDPFSSLASGILSQQVSGAAANAIKKRFVALFNPDTGSFPTPSQVLTSDVPTLRTAGLSERKAEYIYGLAEKFANGDLSTEMLLEASYEEVLEKLIAVRGLGKWSVEMFACFGLKRLDVFSTGDLGVQRGMAALTGRDVGKLKAKGGGKWKYMNEKDMLEMSEKFAPYRSVFMWYMWRVEETDVSILES